MAELAATSVVEAVSNLSQKNKLIILSVTPTSTSDLLTFDHTTVGGLMTKCEASFSKIITAQAYDSSTGMPKSISHNGSTILTTVGWTAGDNKWFIWLFVQNNYGEQT